MRKCFFLFTIILFCFSGCKSDDRSNTVDIDGAVVVLDEENAVGELMGIEASSDTSAKSSDIIKMGGNIIEKEEDKKMAVKILEDLDQSKFSSCQDILVEYVKCLDEFKKGNRTPLKEFPIKDDPKILICTKKNLNFNNSLDSLKRIADELVDEYLKSLE